MTLEPRLTIIVPVYNEARYLDRLWESLILQDYKNWDIIFLDDGSTDNSWAWIRRKQRQHKNVLGIHYKHTGSPGLLRNNGADIATGDIIIFLDADMMVTHNTLHQLSIPILEKTAIATCHNLEVRGNNGLLPRLYKNIRSNATPGTMTNIARAIDRREFLSMKFDTSLGYYDDRLPTNCSLIVDTLIYHNNPETLGEALHHLKWVLKSTPGRTTP